MAVRKTLDFLPIIFRTDANQKFLSATLDQLVSEPNLKNINGYIGRKFAPTFKAKDSYIIENTAERQNYQLEPSIVGYDEQSDVTFFSSYIDLLNKIRYYGGLTENHDRLFESEYYTYDPMICFDTFVNFSQYYWLPDGPMSVDVNTSGVALTKDFTVTRDQANNDYVFTAGGEANNTIILARGGSYTFNINQAGNPFWIQTELGVDGMLNATPTISTREVLGVTNNGASTGTITFNVPQKNAQDRYLSMVNIANVDYAVPLAYSQIHNWRLSALLAAHPEYASVANNLNSKTMVFVDQDQLTNMGEGAWTAPEVYDSNNNPIPGYGAGEIVPDADRYDVWKFLLVDDGSGDPIIRLVWTQDIAINEKVYVRYGVQNANREFYKDYDGFMHRIPVISCVQDTLYIQDENNPNMFTTIKIVDTLGWNIDVVNDILGQKTYTSPNGIKFTSGLKIAFSTDVTPASYQNKQFYVEGVGSSINLVEVDALVTPEIYNDENALNYPGVAFPDYITINRDSLDLNAWSRNNRWFHREVIEAAARYNGLTPTFDQAVRAQRPIIRFDRNIQLLNYGRIGKFPVNVLDTIITDAFNDIEGKVYDVAFGVTLTDGMRVIFAADNDPAVRNKIYTLNLVQYEADIAGLPTGPYHIKLTIADDGNVEENDTVVITSGVNKGKQWKFNGIEWSECQQKTALQQEPIFDVFDASGVSLTTYTRSTFNGTKIFGYKRSTSSVSDSVLGFPLSYRNFSTQGDIEFQNYFETDTFNYSSGQQVVEENISVGFLHKNIDRTTFDKRNVWVTAVEPSRQYQLISYTYDGTSTSFTIDAVSTEATSVPHIKVYKNSRYLTNDKWTLSGNTVTITDTLTIDDKVDILVHNRLEVSSLGYYQVPSNLDLNAQNTSIDNLTLGQIRNHLAILAQNSTDVQGDINGINNLRDLSIKRQGGSILQHSAPVPYSAIFLLDETANFVKSLRYAQQEYSRFKNKFLELSATLSGIDPTDAPASVDLILTTINAIKNKTFPWYYSDMVPYGTAINVVEYPIFDPLVRSYEITNVFNDAQLSNIAVLVYHNGVQLIKGRDYTFDTDRPAVTFTDNVTLAVDDIIKFVEYSNTDGNYIPETPTKLGLYPKFIPELFVDDTYRDPINVIRGHDGSITPAFNDYRDNFLVELEKRIFNNIKLAAAEGSYQDIYSVIPGKFRDNDYSNDEANQILSTNFLNWIGNNKLDFSINSTFNSNDPFTWNYAGLSDRVNGEVLPGSWRACYTYFYDTLRPHMTPWEMLGFSIKPDWWENYYGPAPYTGGNNLLWQDLEAGRIVDGPRAGIDVNFARPGLTSIIPVDENGFLLSPAAIMTAAFNSRDAGSAWAVGEIGPVEAAWRNSSDFPFAIQQAVALAKPARYFGTLVDTDHYAYDYDVNQYLTTKNHHIRQTDIMCNGATINGVTNRSSGYLNWVADYLTSLGINPSTKISSLLKYYQVNLAYKMAGFSDQKYVQVLAEQSSPSSTNDSVVIPNENYKVHLAKSTPVQKLDYSAVIVEKTDNGYSVRGYDLSNPYFTIIPSVVNSHAQKITVLNSSVTVFYDYQPVKITVPYGHEFKNQQQLADFLISYERYLISQGFVFTDVDEQLAEVKNWTLSVKEFLFWAQQGWKPGSILVLSPVTNTLNINTVGAIVDEIADNIYTSKVLDQNFKLVKNNNYNVVRTPTSFKITLTNNAVIAYTEVDLVQYEHVLIFDNSTVFNDVIYRPELGNRQFRLKLVGQKTAEWNGSMYAPGFIYNSGNVQAWAAGTDYLKGDLVEYKNLLYVALENVIATSEFEFAKWKQISSSEIKKGLLPNFASLAVKSQSYYDAYGYFNDSDQVKYSHGLIGFKPRQYLDDLGMNETTQIEFYKGYIKQKGTANAIDRLTVAEFNNLSSSIQYHEEWAIRVGEYGAIETNPYVEIALDEKAYSVNPAIAEFVGVERNNEADGLTIFSKELLYKSTDVFDGNIALTRDNNSNYDNDLPTAGYVNIDDVDTAIFDLASYKELNNQLANIGSGYTIWCAKDFTQDWNVYRVTETDTHVVSVSNSLDGFITFEFSDPHNLDTSNVFLVRNFDSAFDGFYRVYKAVSLYEIMVEYTGNTDDLTTQTGDGILFNLDSLRFAYMEDARQYIPPHGWKAGEKIWIDVDAATSLTQGQPVATENNTWKVYEKTLPWDFKQNILRGEPETNDGFGTSVKISNDSFLIVTGTPMSGNAGMVNTFVKNAVGEFVQGVTLIPDVGNVSAFGTSIDLATERLVVGAPGSNANNGFVFVYSKPESTTTFSRAQVLVGNLSANSEQFGTSVSYDEHGRWLYVGAPGNDRVYVYGLNEHVTEVSTIISTSGMSSNINLPFVPDVNDVNSISVTTNTQTYLPGIDYQLVGNVLVFTGNVAADDVTVQQKPYYTLISTLQGPTGSEFGSAIDASWDGAQLAVGAPNSTVNGLSGAGSVYAYDRVIEAFNATGGQVYTTNGNIGLVYRVTVDGNEVHNYTVTGTNTIQFITPPAIGSVVYIETNEINLLEQITGTAVQQGARFGTSLTVCSNNCAIYVGAPYYNNGTAYNTGAVFKFHNRGRLYGTNVGTVQNPTFTPGDTIRLDNFLITITGTTLADVINDINNANILGVTAVDENGYLRLYSDKTVAKNLLRILSGNGTVWADAGLAVFAEMQIIVAPYNNLGEYFGSKVILASNAYMLVISSDRGTTKEFTTLDNGTTTLDNNTTGMHDVVVGSGSTYIYELYDDPRDAVEHPGRYAFCQQLNPGTLNPGDRFGAAIDVSNGYVVVTSPADDTTMLDAGSLYLFENPTRTRGWNLLRYQQPTVDIDSVNRIYMYNKMTNTVVDNLEFIDPIKGKILGQAEQNISFKTEYDPAAYNRGNNPSVQLNDSYYWTSAQVGKVWWDLSMVRFVDYEQDTLTYRSINWGRVFPGSVIEVLEWVESDVLPSQYVAAGNNGVPKYEDDSAYVELNVVDSTTNIIGSKYYFWVKNKTSLDANNPTRTMPIQTIKEFIENPKGQGLAYAAIIKNNALIVYNVSSVLSDSDTILHLDYEIVKNENIIHSEYELIQEGNPDSNIPTKIVNKMIDSLAGVDSNGALVPDPKLSVAERYGISVRPRQSMFIDRLKALNELVSYVNGVLISTPVSKKYDLTQLNDEEPIPTLDSGEYNIAVNTDTELQYLDTTTFATGYKVLVRNDTTQDNMWVIYQFTATKQWEIYRIQSYKSSLYWDYVDWFATGYSAADKTTYVANTLVDALKLPYAVGDTIKINNTGSGEWQVVVINSSLGFDTVGIQNGTIQLSPSLGDFENNNLGFDNQGFDFTRYDQNPGIETRSILTALDQDIFINELAAEHNNSFFVLIHYLLSEQKYVDWIFKSSFISVIHKLRNLEQYPNYIKDNQTYFSDYINEVKPYSAKVREYLVGYNGNDEFKGSVTDFDLAPYYDTDVKMFRSPSGENVVKDEQLWATGYNGSTLVNQDYPQWYNNRNHIVSEILIENAGEGYAVPPSVTITGGGAGASGATAVALINNVGAITGITVTNGGGGYYLTPTVVINGSATTPASAYAVLKNDQVRGISTTMKFDRISYTSSIIDWTPNTAFTANTIVSYNGVGYKVKSNITTGATFNPDFYTIYSAAEFNNANDRIMAYYSPLSGMPAKDLNQLVYGVEYPGVQVQGISFDQAPGFDGKYDITIFDNVQYDSDGMPIIDDAAMDTIIRSTYTDSALGTRPEDIDVDGGAYVDTYSSHAPEELIPGVMFDTLDMQVYTKINSNVDIVGFRIFSSMLGVDPDKLSANTTQGRTSFLRIADANTTILTADLAITDTVIHVADASKLPEPSPLRSIPGVIFVNGERITYWVRDLATNTLSQIRRSTSGTAGFALHAAGSLAVDGSINQRFPTVTSSAMLYEDVLYNQGVGTATDGLGLDGSVTVDALFLKEKQAIYTVGIVSEDAVNILTTEDGQIIIEE